MASREGDTLLKENIEGSNDSTSHSGSTAEYLTASGCSADYLTASGSSEATDKDDTRGFTKSGPAVLQPSKDLTRYSDGTPRSLLRGLFSCPTPPTLDQIKPFTLEVSISSSSDSYSHEDEHQTSGDHRSSNEQEVCTSSSGESHGREDEPLLSREHRRPNQQRADEPRTNLRAAFMKCYKNCVRKIGNSWFIYIFQFLIGLVCISAIVMGIIHFGSCEGELRYTHPFFLVLSGIFGLPVVYTWVAKVRRERRGERYWNYEKNGIILFLVVALTFMAFEFMFFTQITPITLQIDPSPEEKEVKCIKTYYDYAYYKHIANAVSLVLAALLYLPDCCFYIFTYKRLVRTQQNGQYTEPQ